MPAGCDFVCKNKECECFDTGFTISAPWPMGEIEDVVKDGKVRGVHTLEEAITELKEAGRKYACIVYPNINKVEVKCWRVNLWSNGSKRIWQYDVEKVENEDLLESIEKANLPDRCPETGSRMMNFVDVAEEGILCPYCKEELEKNKWFSKEI